MKIRYEAILAVLGVCINTLAVADCLNVRGQVQTQSISSNVQVGGITMTPVPSSASKFKAAFGKSSLIGGIRGEIISQDPTGVYLNHEIGFPGTGAFTSSNDKATTISFDAANGVATVQEVVNLVSSVEVNPYGIPYGGMFAGWTGVVVADGKLDLRSGVNTFTYSGKICK